MLHGWEAFTALCGEQGQGEGPPSHVLSLEWLHVCNVYIGSKPVPLMDGIGGKAVPSAASRC